MSEDATFTDATEAERYEIRLGGELAGFLEYRGRGDVHALVHTEVLAEFEGKGVGGRLVRHALDEERAAGRTIVPICPFVHKFLAEHDEYLDLLQPHIRKAFHLDAR